MNWFCLGLVVLAAFVADAADILVQTANGRVRGKYMKDGVVGTEYNAYTCLPYAKPPINELRFKPPVPADSWNNIIREPLTTCPVCPQFEYLTNKMVGKEDCLFLNVYVPAKPTSEELPVMVWIHGGEWRTHGGTIDLFNPSYILANNNVILVTMNYRFGPLGFLSTGDAIVPGNNGLKDQSLALQWVQNNIKSFGGSPRKVTIFGSSTGAASVRYHMISPMSEGLFRAAICQGGNELNTWAWQGSSDASSLFRRLATSLNCTSLDNEAIIDCLKKCSAESIIGAEGTTFANDMITTPLMIFKPVTEVPNENAFLSKDPLEILQNGEYNDVPMILGITQSDGAFVYADYWSHNNSVSIKPEWILPRSSPAFKLGYSEKATVAKKVYDRYIQGLETGDKKKLRDSTIQMITDAWYRQGHETLLTYKRKTHSADIFQYRLSYSGQFNFAKWLGYPEKLDASHYDDEIYLFPSSQYFKQTLNAQDTAMSKKIVELWVNFATYLTPTSTTEGTVNWAPVTTARHEYLDIVAPNNLSMKSSMDEKRTEFWKELSCDYVFESVHCN